MDPSILISHCYTSMKYFGRHACSLYQASDTFLSGISMPRLWSRRMMRWTSRSIYMDLYLHLCGQLVGNCCSLYFWIVGCAYAVTICTYYLILIVNIFLTSSLGRQLLPFTVCYICVHLRPILAMFCDYFLFIYRRWGTIWFTYNFFITWYSHWNSQWPRISSCWNGGRQAY